MAGRSSYDLKVFDGAAVPGYTLEGRLFAMNVLVRAVVSGFGFSLGSALYKRVSKRLGLDESDKDSPDPDTAVSDEDSDVDDGDE